MFNTLPSHLQNQWADYQVDIRFLGPAHYFEQLFLWADLLFMELTSRLYDPDLLLLASLYLLLQRHLSDTPLSDWLSLDAPQIEARMQEHTLCHEVFSPFSKKHWPSLPLDALAKVVKYAVFFFHKESLFCSKVPLAQRFY